MRSRLPIFCVLVALAIGAPPPAQAADALVLQPSSAWNIDYDTDSCALRRTFGKGDQTTTLELRRFSPASVFQTTVVTGATKMNSGNFRYRFDPDKAWLYSSVEHHAYFDGDRDGVIFKTELRDVKLHGLEAKDLAAYEQTLASADFLDGEAETASKVASLSLARAFRRDLVLMTGSLKDPLLAMRTCIDELRGHWGIDLKAHEQLKRPAVPTNRAGIARMMDYPPKMLAKNMPGIVNLRFAVDERGSITGCFIQMPLSDPAFEKSSCADLEHELQFEPALDKDGKPVASYWVTSVDFVP